VVVDLERRVALLSVFIGACVGCTCESGWSGSVWRADAAALTPQHQPAIIVNFNVFHKVYVYIAEYI
jgi:hypothetical protein